MRILVTGANGFVGRQVCTALSQRGLRARAVVRDPEAAAVAEEVVVLRPGETGCRALVRDVDTVIHLAARVHVMSETSINSLDAYRAVNVDFTRAVARAAAESGVKRLVFVSSIKVNGESTVARAFAPDDSPNPSDAYSLSKWEAEQVLWQISAETGMGVVVVRPPIVYGPGVGGNFLRFLKLVASGWPLPFGSVNNRRSMISNMNLSDVLIECATRIEASGKTYLVADAEEFSTTELIRRLARMMGRRPRLVGVPEAVLRAAGTFTGKAAELDRLLGSLRLDTARVTSDLGWVPRVPAAAALQETVDWFLHRRP